MHLRALLVPTLIAASALLNSAVADDKGDVAAGRELYVSHCASCHGKDGKGDGPAASALKTRPPNLTVLAKQNGGKFPAGNLYQVIKWGGGIVGHGSKEMPVWGRVFLAESSHKEQEAAQRIRDLLQYMESLQEK